MTIRYHDTVVAVCRLVVTLFFRLADTVVTEMSAVLFFRHADIDATVVMQPKSQKCQQVGTPTRRQFRRHGGNQPHAEPQCQQSAV